MVIAFTAREAKSLGDRRCEGMLNFIAVTPTRKEAAKLAAMQS